MVEHNQRSIGTPLDPERPVGWESRKTYGLKIANGFFDKYLSGSAILEIGYKGGIDGAVPILPQAIGIDVDYPGYDGATLPFPDESQDGIYTVIALSISATTNLRYENGLEFLRLADIW